MKDPLSRTAGVGSVQLFGSEYAMRIWLDPQKPRGGSGCPINPCISSSAPESGDPSVNASGAPI
nr:efflux RND transporter permease subunit [Escherichia coli]